MKGLEKYIRFYIGQKIINNVGNVVDLIGCRLHSAYYEMCGEECLWSLDAFPVKLVLRKLNTMTPTEFNSIMVLKYEEKDILSRIDWLSLGGADLYSFLGVYGRTDTIINLCEAGFDIFGLIDAGMAVDKDTLPVYGDVLRPIRDTKIVTS